MTETYVSYIFTIDLVSSHPEVAGGFASKPTEMSVDVELFPHSCTHFKVRILRQPVFMWGSVRRDGLVSLTIDGSFYFFTLDQLNVGLKEILKVARYASAQLIGSKAEFTAEPVEGLREWTEEYVYGEDESEEEDEED